MNFKAVAQAEGDNVAMSGLLKSRKVMTSKAGKQYAKCVIVDNAGAERPVALFMGKKGLPLAGAVGQDCMFSLSCKLDDNGNPSYSGFFNAISTQPVNSQNRQSNRASNEELIVRQCAFKGAIELACAGKIPVTEIMANTFEFATDIMAGKIITPDDDRDDDGQSSDDIPF